MTFAEKMLKKFAADTNYLRLVGLEPMTLLQRRNFDDGGTQTQDFNSWGIPAHAFDHLGYWPYGCL